MKSAAVILVASAALASAQATYNSTDGKYYCAEPGQAYCAGESLLTDIILRCDSSGIGQPGRCTDNLDGEPPVGLNTALCWQTSNTTGDAACEKNCVVYGGSGNFNGTFTLPTDECTPYYTASSSMSSSESASSTVVSSSVSTSESSQISITTVTSESSTTVCSTSSVVSVSSLPHNSTITIISGSSTSSTPSKTPVGPTSSSTSAPTTLATAGAAANHVGGALAALGLVAAYIL